MDIEYNLTTYHKFKKLGKGAYSCVFSYINLEDQKRIAIKKYILQDYNGISFDMIKELSILKYVNSDFLIKILDIDYKNFEYTIMPEYNFTLHTFYKQYNLNVRTISQIFYDICYGVYHMHSKGIIHRDLKSINILVYKTSNSFKPIIIDTGLSRIYNDNLMTTKVVTLSYRAPELLIGKKKYDFSIDMWSLGCLLAELFNKSLLFPTNSEIDLLIKQFKLLGTPHDDIFFKDYVVKFPKYQIIIHEKYKYIDKTGLNLIINLLKLNPKNRYTIAECLNHKFLNNDYVFLEAEYNRNKFLKEYTYKYSFKKRISKSVNFEMRRILLDWILSIVHEYNQNLDIFFISVSILDRFLCIVDSKNITIENFQLIGAACLLIASKLHSVEIIEMENLYIPGVINENNIIEMEKFIVKSLDFNLIIPILSNYLIIFDLDKEEKNNILNNCIISIFYKSYIDYSPYNFIKSMYNANRGVFNNITGYFKDCYEYFYTDPDRYIFTKKYIREKLYN